MLQPGLEVAGASLDNGARIEAVFREPYERGLVEIIEQGEAVFTRRAYVNMRAARVAMLEQRKSVDHRGGGDGVETGEHTPIAQDADIVERRLYCCEHISDCNLGFVHQSLPIRCCSSGEGCRGRKVPAALLGVP
jgi:hypothetical protein